MIKSPHMLRTTFLSLVALSWLGTLLASNSFAESETSQKPNVLFIAVDDMRDWVGYLKGYKGQVLTPNIDRLADTGTPFTNAHCASPVCCPSRAAVMSGRFPSSTGVYNNGQWWKPHMPELTTLPVHFKSNGYEAVGAGKLFHHTVGNNPPGQWDAYHRLVFEDDAFSRTSGRITPLYPFTAFKPFPEEFPLSGIRPYSNEVDWGVLDKPEPAFDDAKTATYAIDYLKQEHDKPFFLACGLFHPHLPWYVPPKYLKLYNEKDPVLPKVKTDDLDDVPEPGKKLALRKYEDLQRLHKANKWNTAVQHYLASISFADAQIGRLIDALAESPHADNTIVVLWSDHGWHLGEKNHWHKRTLWEEATRVPLIIMTPDTLHAGTRCAEPVSLVDLFPTLIDLCQLPPVQKLSGQSLVPLLKDPASKRAHPAVTEDENRHCAVRDIRYRYIRYNDGSEELYDMQTDPLQWNNLAGDPEMKPTKTRLAQFIPKTWAPHAPTKSAYQFEPFPYRWTHKKTGKVTEGGSSVILNGLKE